jgi:hypothetical protein
MTDADIHQLVVSYLFPALVVFTGVVAYFFGIRPTLRKNPAFSHFYENEDTALNAISAKLSGVKQKLTTVFLSAAGFLVLAHDQIAPLVAQTGVDPTLILPKVPMWVWPLVSIGVLWLIQYFRDLADKQARANAEALLNAGHSLVAPAPGLPVSTLPSPNPVLNAFPDKVG